MADPRFKNFSELTDALIAHHPDLDGKNGGVQENYVFVGIELHNRINDPAQRDTVVAALQVAVGDDKWTDVDELAPIP